MQSNEQIKEVPAPTVGNYDITERAHRDNETALAIGLASVPQHLREQLLTSEDPQGLLDRVSKKESNHVVITDEEWMFFKHFSFALVGAVNALIIRKQYLHELTD